MTTEPRVLAVSGNPALERFPFLAEADRFVCFVRIRKDAMVGADAGLIWETGGPLRRQIVRVDWKTERGTDRVVKDRRATKWEMRHALKDLADVGLFQLGEKSQWGASVHFDTWYGMKDAPRSSAQWHLFETTWPGPGSDRWPQIADYPDVVERRGKWLEKHWPDFV